MTLEKLFRCFSDSYKSLLAYALGAFERESPLLIILSSIMFYYYYYVMILTLKEQEARWRSWKMTSEEFSVYEKQFSREDTDRDGFITGTLYSYTYKLYITTKLLIR